MTYCVAMLLDQGMIFASDTRTNAGIDNISKFCKMRTFTNESDRVMVALSSGNLSVTQSSINLMEHNSRVDNGQLTMWNATSMFDIATLLGDALREVKRRDGPSYLANNIDSNASFLLGGQIRGERPRLFLVYSEGNFIEATAETCYFQIGEIKYGKPIIDRTIQRDTDLNDATKATLVSFDSTMRSNLSVGMPIDLAVYRTDSFQLATHRRLEESDPYFQMIHHGWSDGLKQVFAGLPNPKWF